MDIGTEVKHICPLCEAGSKQQSIKSNSVYGGTSDQKFWQCSECNVIYLYPTTSEEDDITFYENEFDKWMIKRSNDDTWTDPAIQFSKMQRRELPLRLPYLKKLIKPRQRVLEIGSSSGFLLTVLKEWGCDCIGIEINRKYADYACKLGIKTYYSWNDLRAVDKGNFDLLLHYYVLEHVLKPLDFLQECLKHIKPGGIMLFEIPNANDPLISLYQVPAFNLFYWWRAHHWYFTPTSLKYLLGKLGCSFEIWPGQRYDLSNHIHWMLTGQPGGMGKYKHIFSPATEKSYAEDLKKHWLCDYLTAIVTT